MFNINEFINHVKHQNTPLDTRRQTIYIKVMSNPFTRNKQKIGAKTFEPKQQGEKPNIVKTFAHFFPNTPLKRSSRALMSLCPLHGENNPSFAVYEETNTYYCFSCQETGDSYTLIMKLENLEFRAALEYAENNNLYD